MRTLTVNVTLEDIQKGNPGSACYCPIARAIERAIESDVGVYKKYWSSSVVNWASQPLPLNAQNFIHEFDNYEQVQPFSFEIQVP